MEKGHTGNTGVILVIRVLVSLINHKRYVYHVVTTLRYVRHLNLVTTCLTGKVLHAFAALLFRVVYVVNT